MNSIVGQCPHCGAPIYAPSMWHGVCPPPSIRSCLCIPTASQHKLKTSTGALSEDNFKITYKNILDEDKFKEIFEKS